MHNEAKPGEEIWVRFSQGDVRAYRVIRRNDVEQMYVVNFQFPGEEFCTVKYCNAYKTKSNGLIDPAV